MKPITYLSDQAKDYSDAITKADTLDKLLAVFNEYRPLVADAIRAAPKNEDEFIEFRTGLKKEKRGRFAGEEWQAKWASVLLPEVLFIVGMTACQFHAPWGCAFIRMKQEGMIAYRAVHGDNEAEAYIVKKP